MHSQQMISTHPDVRGDISSKLVQCIDECFACAQACASCADACLAESSVAQLRQVLSHRQDLTRFGLYSTENTPTTPASISYLHHR